jgi:Tfp pilus assembly protein PilW
MSARRAGRAPGGEGGFTLIEVFITVILLGIGTAVFTRVFIGGYRNWKKSFDTLILQRNSRLAMATITRALREASPGTVSITTPSGMPMFSNISFTDGRGNNWAFWQKGSRIYMGSPPPAGVASATSMLASDIDALSFTYPSFQQTNLIQIGILGRKIPYQGSESPIIVQLVEQTFLRNP